MARATLSSLRRYQLPSGTHLNVVVSQLVDEDRDRIKGVVSFLGHLVCSYPLPHSCTHAQYRAARGVPLIKGIGKGRGMVYNKAHSAVL